MNINTFIIASRAYFQHGATSTRFLKELIYCYGYPHIIITDNGTNFTVGEMSEFFKDRGI